MVVVVVDVKDAWERWGTWEELILGGAVLRHGTDNWDAVASELQTRTRYPFAFTPQACKAKYVDLQQRYDGSTVWVDELRKRRVDELKKELKKSDDSISSLESKLEKLKADKRIGGNADYRSSHTKSPTPFPKTEGNESSIKNVSKNKLSISSFTQEAPASGSPNCQAMADVSAVQAVTKPVLHFPGRELFPGIEKIAKAIHEAYGVIRRKRGERKRRVCMKDTWEGSVGENHLMGSANTGIDTCHSKENLTSNCKETVRSSDTDDRKKCTSKGGVGELMGILDSLMQSERVCIFQHRRDSQKRARYKKLVRHHLDLDTIRSRIVQGSIISARELFRDLLLLANNALIFYSKNTREHKCASLLRGIVKRMLHQYYTAGSGLPAVPPPADIYSSATHASTPPPTHKNSANDGRTGPLNCKVAVEVVGAKRDARSSAKGDKAQGNAAGSPQSMESSAGTMKGPVRRRGGKVVRFKLESPGLQDETLIKDRKRARAR